MSEQAQPAVARRRRERESLRSMIPARYLLKKRYALTDLDFW